MLRRSLICDKVRSHIAQRQQRSARLILNPGDEVISPTDTQTLYKWLHPDRTTTYQHVRWPKRAKVWTPNKTPRLCVSGWHLATHEGISEHARVDAVLWTAEGRGAHFDQLDKVVFTSARIIEPVGTLTRQIAVQWAAECAKRVLRHYEDRYPNDKRPREAVNAALEWAKDPSEKNAYAAAAYASANAAYAAHAAYAAYAAHAANANAYAYANARSKERTWQSDRLLTLLGASS